MKQNNDLVTFYEAKIHFNIFNNCCYTSKHVVKMHYF